MKKYISPNVELIEVFEVNDILTASGESNEIITRIEGLGLGDGSNIHTSQW